MNFIIFLLGFLVLIAGLILIVINKKEVNLKPIMTSIKKVQAKDISYHVLLVIIGVAIMFLGASIIPGRNVKSLRQEISTLENDFEDKEIQEKKKLTTKTEEIETLQKEVEKLEGVVEKLEEKVIQLTVLSDNDKELLVKNYNDLSGKERARVNEILDNIDSYNEECQKIIKDNKDRIKKEKEEYIDKKNAIKEKEAEEQKERQAQEKEKKVKKTNNETENINKKSEHALKSAARKVFGDQLDEIQVINGIDGPGRVNISAQMSDNLKNTWILAGFQKEIIEFAQEIQNEDFESVYFMGYFDMQDNYGNKKNIKIVDIELSKETINKINFENFFADNLESVADVHEVHPGLLN